MKNKIKDKKCNRTKETINIYVYIYVYEKII